MKKFSLKALGATLLAAGLVIAGAAAPAQAAAALTLSTTTFSTSATTASGLYAELTGTTIQNNFDTIVVGPNSAPGSAWTIINTCPVFGSATAGNEADCGISSITIGGTAVTGWKAYKDNGTGPKIRLYKLNAGTGFSSGQAIKVTFAASAWTTSSTSSNSTFDFTTMYNGGANLDSVSTNVTVGTPTSTVTFNANGGTGTMANQVSGVSAALTANTFTRAGYTFTGWNTLANGNGTPFADGATYNFLTNRTLYAQWTAGGGGGSSASVNLTLNASTGQLVAGSSVAVVASGLQATAPYTVVVQSTPQTIGSGNAVSGAVNTSVTLPAGLEAGWHTLTFSSTAADGSAVSSVTYFKVSASGTLLATSSTIPAELAQTGFDGMPYLFGGLALATAGATLLLIARRKRSN